MSRSRIIQGVLLSGIFAGALYAGPALVPAFGANANQSSGPVPNLGMTQLSSRKPRSAAIRTHLNNGPVGPGSPPDQVRDIALYKPSTSP
jgi:hypothetical protein